MCLAIFNFPLVENIPACSLWLWIASIYKWFVSRRCSQSYSDIIFSQSHIYECMIVTLINDLTWKCMIILKSWYVTENLCIIHSNRFFGLKFLHKFEHRTPYRIFFTIFNCHREVHAALFFSSMLDCQTCTAKNLALFLGLYIIWRYDEIFNYYIYWNWMYLNLMQP